VPAHGTAWRVTLTLIPFGTFRRAVPSHVIPTGASPLPPPSSRPKHPRSSLRHPDRSIPAPLSVIPTEASRRDAKWRDLPHDCETSWSTGSRTVAGEISPLRALAGRSGRDDGRRDRGDPAGKTASSGRGRPELEHMDRERGSDITGEVYAPSPETRPITVALLSGAMRFRTQEDPGPGP